MTGALVLLMGCAAAWPAYAEPVRIAFEIDVRHTFGDLRDVFGAPIAIGDIVPATLTYDTSALDTAPSPQEGHYRFNGAIAFGVGSTLTLPVEDISLFDELNPRLGFDDGFSAFALTQSFPGFDAVQAELSWRGVGYSGDALPESAAEFVAAFATGGIRFSGWETGVNPPFDSGTHELAGTVRVVSETPQPVPEPGTLLLVGAGAATLLRRHRRGTSSN